VCTTLVPRSTDKPSRTKETYGNETAVDCLGPSRGIKRNEHSLALYIRRAYGSLARDVVTPVKGPLTLPRPAQLRDHALPVGPDEVLLVAAYVVNVNLVEPQIHVVLDVLQVLIEVGGCQDAVLKVVDVD